MYRAVSNCTRGLLPRGYPGSNYTLTYDKDEDRLVGVYYHAVLQQSFDIYFERQVTEKEKK